ncbi:MAG: amino acid ABC transporter substrate-binding protein [Clostridia bacterium]|nr:MAG: amino acid ABC transporter substrate-binding protein [Clostridia bacterium]
MKKIFALALALMMVLAAFAGCTNGTTEPTEAPTGTEAPATTDPTPDSGASEPSAEGKKLVIGGIGPLTGDYATYGVSVKQGAEMAVKEINEAGGVNGLTFELLFEDDQTDAEMAVNAYNKLMDNGMQVSLGAVTSGACIAVTEEVQKDGILMITPSGSQKECVQYDTCFRICFTDPDQGIYAAQFIADNKIATKVAVIYDKSNDYSNGIKDNFVAKAAEVGLEVVSEQAFTDQSRTDFSVQLQAIASSGAELVFLPIYAQEAAYILTQAQSANISAIFFGCDGLDGVIEKIGADNVSATEGVMLLTPFAADAQDEQTVAFTAAYKAAYNATPDQFAADGYDAIYTIKAALEQSGAKPGDADFNEKMVAAMTAITVEGLTGTMTWSADGEPTKSATAVVIKDGAYVAYAAE